MATLAEQLQRFLEPPGDQQPTGEGRNADFERGIVLKGPWEAYADGFAEHTRRNARALAMTGIPIALRSISPKIRIATDEEAEIDVQYRDLLERTVASVEAQIFQLVPVDGTLHLLTSHKYYSLEEQRFINGRKVFYTVWERMKGLNEEDLRSLKSVGQVWVACQASKDFLVSEGIEEAKVRVFPVPYLPDDPMLAVRQAPKAKNARPSFYHVGKWEPRKEQRNILGGFLCAFRPGECMLMMKTSEKSPYFQGYPPSIAISTQEWLDDERVKANGWTKDNVGQDVFAVTRRISNRQMQLLHQKSDCYVTLARGEGFDMPAFDAKLAGNLMLFTPSGGPQDFAHPEDVRVESTGLVDVHPYYRWAKGSQYLDYSFESVIEGYRIAAQKIRDGVVAKRDLSEFSAEAVGKRMAESLKELGDIGI